MKTFNGINLSDLPFPDVIETIAYEDILGLRKAELIARSPASAAVLELESEPLTKLLEVFAYGELTLRQRVNDAARSLLLAFARQADLEHLAASYNVTRQILTPGDDQAFPPVPPVYEGDEDLRRRTQLAPEAFTTAGSEGSYIFNALSAGETPTTVSIVSPEPGKVVLTYEFPTEGFSAKVKHASAYDPAPGQVLVSVLSRDGNGTADTATLNAVTQHLSGKYVRPLTDQLTVQSAQIVEYQVTATLHLYDGPDLDLVQAEATRRFWLYAGDRHALGEIVTSSGIDAALQIAGVRKVELDGWTDITTTQEEAPFCTALNLTVVGDS
ncbi:baseplate J/gp47 family protein [Kiloniella laminariae]|uniref:Baseplate J/gp47 family protein n=1 Tax=Kiloniella laminariae TaxID=454162 RepID=A0ABT4LMY1_9PROT|nr:baseplate J/gp47 family protein [Kiloniella laminariae]MCZ4281701.1 baseplate J/gp47 family protein [Kiloniella laminariae]